MESYLQKFIAPRPSDVHYHKSDFEVYECQRPSCKAKRLVSTSVEDLHSSLSHYTVKDEPVLFFALNIVKRRGEKTKANMIAAKLKKLNSK